MIPLMSLIASATATGAMLTMCSSKDRQASRKTASKKSAKSSKSKRAGSKSSRASSSASGTKSHRSSKSGGKSSRSHRKSKKGAKSSKSKKDGSKKSSAAKVGVAALPPGTSSKRQSETKKSSRSERSTSKKSKRSGKKCKAQQCDPNKLKKEQKRNAICQSNSSDASSKSGKSGKRQKKQSSGSGSLSGEKALNAVPNSSNYKFPEGQIKPSSFRPSPNKLPFAPTGGVQTLVIPNSSKSRKAFKVKTSDNMLYRVNPVHGFVEPGQNMSIDVLRHNGNDKTDHLVVLTSDATANATCAKAIFETDPPRELTVVPLVAH